MPLDAHLLALGAAFLHAFWNLLIARAKDPEAATAVALLVALALLAALDLATYYAIATLEELRAWTTP